ncbi:MAG TPA: hypothetical protein VMJ75_00410 [Candidatus Acidoferrales bacterium]|nr:hypothetical protein [Candidatus Acidoferrales bacterium]
MGRVTESTQLTTADLADVANARERSVTDVEVTGPAAPRETEGTAHRGNDSYTGPLLPHDISDGMRTRWETVQAAFVDDPRVAVQDADELVAAAIKKLAETFAGERARLEQQWSSGSDVSTEDLRQALRQYRAFFQRLLSL